MIANNHPNSVRRSSCIVWVLLIAMCVGLAAPMHGAQVSGLYDVRVGVDSQNPELRDQAASDGLLELLTRLTGLTSVPRNEAVTAALRSPERYYNRFGYEEGDDAHPTYLSITFDSAAVTGLIRSARLPLWGSNRPTAVVWIALREGGQRSLVGSDSDDESSAELIRALRRAAERRGLPITFPLLDLTDVAQVSPAVVWGRLADVVVPASERYDADVVVMGRVERAAGGYTGSWRWRLGNEEGSARSTSRDVQTTANVLIDDLANTLAGRFAVLGRSLRVVRADISGVNSAGDYGRLMRYLTSHQAFERVALQKMVPTGATIALATRTSDEQLLDLLRLDGHLEAAGPAGFDGALALRWRGGEG
ncbi:MAG: DUF2066 domain-containing protein [Pseudomonadaceae bacterium]|nr:DUF2066 domain-containing protein [Pseudomonadaceae bacterium]